MKSKYFLQSSWNASWAILAEIEKRDKGQYMGRLNIILLINAILSSFTRDILFQSVNRRWTSQSLNLK